MWCLISLGLGLGIMALYALMIMLEFLSSFHPH